MKENRDTWLLFTHVASCWKYAGMDAQVVGMDYSSVYKIAESIGIDITPRIISGLQAIEKEVIRKSRENMESQAKSMKKTSSRKRR